MPLQSEVALGFFRLVRTFRRRVRVKSRTVRSIKAAHDLSRKTFRLRSKNAEVLLLD